MTILQKNVVQSPRVGQANASANGRSTQGEINSRALLAGMDCIPIRHGDNVYWLRATRQGKLLLTK
ncbi:MAG: hemin uptake protein HemP [Pseudomonadota bacterium]